MVGRHASGVARFFVDGSLVVGRVVALDESESRHVRARRLEPGAPVELLNGAGLVATGTIDSVAKQGVAVAITSVMAVERPLPLHLLAPIGDRDRMLWLGEKATELGLTSWRAVLWHRSRSVTPRGAGESFRGKLNLRMRSALTQSGWAWMPTLHDDVTPDEIHATVDDGRRYLLDPSGEPLLQHSLQGPVTLAVGPEGGFEDSEREALIGAGWIPVSIGDATLRFETAGIAALAIARAAMAAHIENARG